MRKQTTPGRWLHILAILGAVLLLAATAGGSYLWLLHAQASLTEYKSPLLTQPQATGHATMPLSNQVVLVLIDGLRTDAVSQMPTLTLLRQQGATATVRGGVPSYSQPSWTALVTGAWPEINGAAVLNAADDQIAPIAGDQIFAAAHRANLSTALVGASWWESMIPADSLDSHFYSPGFEAENDQAIADAALRILGNFHPNLTLVYFGEADERAHDSGGTSPEYYAALRRIDDHLRDIVAGLDLRHATLLVFADHGHIDRGGHGGADPAVLNTPLVAVGDSINPGDRGTISQVDFAPTVAAIVGAPMPRLGQGSICWDMLRHDDAKRTETTVDLAEQRLDLGNLYLRSIGIGSLTGDATGDVAVAISSLEVRNLDSAANLAQLAIEHIDQEMAAGRSQRLQREQRTRLPVLLVFAFVPLLVLLFRGNLRAWALLACAAVTLLIYNALYLGQGQVYSFSGLTGLVPFLSGVAQRMVIGTAVAALLILLGLARSGEGSILRVIETSLGYSFWVIYLLGCVAGIVFWINGPTVTWFIPNMSLEFVLLSVLVQALVTAVLALVLPIVLLLIGGAYQGIVTLRRRLAPSTRRS